MHVAFITGSYPTASGIFGGTFVQEFVRAMARQGNECSVISPTSVFDRRFGAYPPTQTIEGAGGGSFVRVFRPKYVSFSSKNLKVTHTGRWTQRTFTAAVVRAAKHLPCKPDIIYGHFLYQGGSAAVSTGRALGLPSVLAVGEGTFWTIDPFGFKRARREFRDVAGFLALGSHIRDGLIEQLGISPEKIRVEPNGVDLSKFKTRGKTQARQHLGLDPSHFLIVFVGTFDNLKGGPELVRATADLEGVGLVLLGQGTVELSSNRIVYKGYVNHEDVSIWLNAADIFVLPTREEGSCNAVIEAMACGLPIVTSTGRYMDDLVDDSMAVRVDPTDVRAISDAIVALKNAPDRRRGMSKACLAQARKFDVNERAQRITAWMEGLVRKH